MKKGYFLVFVSLGFILSLACPGFTQTSFVFQEGVNNYTGTADTFFQTGAPENVRGSDPEWEWDGSDAGGANYGALRFNDIIGTEPGQIPPDSTVLNAILTLTITNSGSSDQVATVHELLKPFSEEDDFIDFTFNFEPTPADDYAEEVIAEIPGPSAGDVIDIDVTASLEGWVSGEDNNGWLFVPGGSNGVGVQAKEASARTIPMLEVDTPIGQFSFKDGENGYDGTVDTWINTGDGVLDVYGEEVWFEWDGSDNGGTNFGLLRFDNIIGTDSGQIPPGTEINSAVVKLSIQDAGDTAEVYEVLPGEGDESTDFDNTTTAMIDFGDGFEPIFGVHYGEDLVATVEGSIGNVEIDVSSSVQSYSEGEPNTGWIFVPTGGGGVEALSSESAAAGGGPAKLTVTIEGDVSVHGFELY